MDERSVRQILLAKYYLHIAKEQLRSDAEVAQFAGINLLHEALETTLITCADHLNAKVQERSAFDSYLDKIDAKLQGRELPFRSRIIQFNKARVAAKHYLTLPERSFVTLMATVIPEFVQSAVELVFEVDFDQVSLVSLIADAEVASYIRSAQSELAAERFYEALVEARKAFYVQFEKRADIRLFSDPAKAAERHMLSEFMNSDAPSWAKDPTYIENYVCRPSDYIVLDHAKLDRDLLKEGVDVQTFWNVWRLTPEVYQFPDGKWVAEFDLKLKDAADLRENCIYVIDGLVAITLQRQAHSNRSRWVSGVNRYVDTMPEAPFYKKARADSPIVGSLPKGVTRANVSMAVPALDGDGWYWEASYMRKNGPWLFGYLRSSDAIGDLQEGLVADGMGEPFIPGLTDGGSDQGGK